MGCRCSGNRELCGAYPSSDTVLTFGDCKTPVSPRRYIQFRDLVLLGSNSVEAGDTPVTFKQPTSTDLGYKFNGSRIPNLCKTRSVEAQTLTLDINISYKGLTGRQMRQFHDFVLSNLSGCGKIWAIDTGGTLIWAYAFVSSFTEQGVMPEKYTIKYSVDFLLWEGVWHKANPNKVYLQEYDVCDFRNSLNYDGTQPECPNCECLSCSKNEPCVKCDSLYDGDDVENLSLCENQDVLAKFYDECHAQYKVVEDCGGVIGPEDYAKTYGFQIALEACNNMIYREFFSDTVLDTQGIEIHVVGRFSDPVIDLNGNAIKVTGDFYGDLMYSNGQWFYKPFSKDNFTGFDCIAPSAIQGLNCSLSYTAMNGNNYLKITFASHDMVYAYISIDSLVF